MLYHLYQRTIKKNGKSIKAWYYWYYGENGKQIRKTCGTNGNPCTVKREAQAFIENLPDVTQLEKKKITFNDFASTMYDDNSPYMIKKRNRGEEEKENTIYQHRLYLKRFLDKFGEIPVDELLSVDIENWLLTLDYSNSVKNSILTVVKDIYEELYIYHLIPTIPLFKMFKRNDQIPKGILSIEEIKALFPDDFNEVINVWKIGRESDVETFTFAAMIFLIISTGMRNCEVRAIQFNQFVQKDALLINAMIDSSNQRTKILKKGNDFTKKWRVVVLPEKTVRMLDNLYAMNQINGQNEYVFTYNDAPMTTDYLRSHFRLVLKKNGIDWKERNIGIHSLRFTYDTIMRPEISGSDLRLMIGHVSEQMTEYYDRSQALDHLPALMQNKSVIDSIFK